MSGFLVRWHHLQHTYQHGEDRFAQEQRAVWETAAYRARGCQATCYEIAADGTELTIPIITWTDRISIALNRGSNGLAGQYEVRVTEGSPGAVDVKCWWPHADAEGRETIGIRKPNWQVKRWATGKLTAEGEFTPAAEIISRLIVHGDWQPMSWRSYEGSEVHRRDEAAAEQFAATRFEQAPMGLFALTGMAV